MNNFTSRKKMLRLFCIVFVFFSGLLSSAVTRAQCTTNTYGAYPSAAYVPLSCSGAPEVIASDCYAGEYSIVSVTSGQTYSFKSSLTSDFVTISTGAAVATAVASGTGTVNWVATITGNVRFWLHTNSSCGSSSVNRSRIVTCGFPAANDAAVSIIYSLGKLPLSFGNNHVVQAVVRNNGSNALSGLDVTLNITGANTFSNVKTISLAPGAQQVVSFDPFTPTATGANVLTVTVPADDVLSNNSKTWNQDVTSNLFSYKNPSASNEVGGVGFTGASGDFVAGFTTASAGALNEIKVDFASGGQSYRVGIWDATGAAGAPGTLLWESATLTSAVGTAFVPVPNITVNGNFFVGVRQINTTNIAFAYQVETPLRTNRFYYTSPTGSTAWTDLSATGSFRFSIEPQFFVPQPPNCAVGFVPANAATVNPYATTSLTWASGGNGATNYDVYFGTNPAPPFLGNTTGTTYAIPALLPSTTYYWTIKANNAYGSSAGCVVNSFTTSIPLSNDIPMGATSLVVGAGCTGADYTLADASLSPGEPFPSCSGTALNPVWFAFEAPVSGAVRVSTDAGSGGTLTDTKVALFDATDVNDFSSFSIISCDEDGGSTIGNNSVLYATGLLAGKTYYVAVDKYSSTTANGTFCLTVDELDNSMISPSNTCASSYQTPYTTAGTAPYTQWFPLLDGSSRLVAMIRNTAGGNASAYTGGQNVNTGAIRNDGNGSLYLDRNFSINNASATNVEVQLFFLNTELAALTAADPAVTLDNIKVIHQSGTSCTNDFSGSATTSTITPAASVNLGTVSYVRFTTPSFSNFFLAGGNAPLPILIKSISAKNAGSINQVDWTTAGESEGDYFELERSNDSRNFSFLARLAANYKPSDYVYHDKAPLEGVNYYRLKLISRDGKIAYSKVVQATATAADMAVEVYPNPAKKNVTVKVRGSENGQVTLSDVSGKVLYQSKMTGTALQIDMSNLANGFYMIRYTDGRLNEVIKINKQ